MYCSKCGAKIDGAKFCPNCGTPTGKNSDASPKVTKKRNKATQEWNRKEKMVNADCNCCCCLIGDYRYSYI